MKNIYIMLIISAILFTSCSTATKSTFLGMGVGVSTGAMTGAIMNKDKKGVLIGSLAFGLIGSLTGFFGHEALKKRDANVRKNTVFNLEKFGVQGMPNSDYFLESLLKQKKKDVYIFTDNPKFFE
jgi:uncharacterized membrane protein YeaQ/YmgE (transglycosylase-associated protein family)